MMCICWYVYAGMCMLVNVCWNAERGYGKSQADCACVPDDPFRCSGSRNAIFRNRLCPDASGFPVG